MRTLWIRAPYWEREGGSPPAVTRASVSYRHSRREDVNHSEMRERAEREEDDPFTALECQHAQSEC